VLSDSLKHLVCHGRAEANPIAETERSAINHLEETMLAACKSDLD
jgi:hypothetical protein